MNINEIRETMTKIADGFAELGFTNLGGNFHSTMDRALGVYLVMDDITEDKTGRSLLDDNLWLRISTQHVPEVGDIATVDFKAGNHWLSVPSVINDLRPDAESKEDEVEETLEIEEGASA
jgi:hypothetical protein